jgi:hypothetical protein
MWSRWVSILLPVRAVPGWPGLQGICSLVRLSAGERPDYPFPQAGTLWAGLPTGAARRTEWPLESPSGEFDERSPRSTYPQINHALRRDDGELEALVARSSGTDRRGGHAGLAHPARNLRCCGRLGSAVWTGRHVQPAVGGALRSGRAAAAVRLAAVSAVGWCGKPQMRPRKAPSPVFLFGGRWLYQQRTPLRWSRAVGCRLGVLARRSGRGHDGPRPPWRGALGLRPGRHRTSRLSRTAG